MKKLSLIILTVCSMLVFGQKVSDYKYISVPESFKTFKEDFDLAKVLAKSLKEKRYIVLQGGKEKWPSDIKGDYCNVLNADILDDSSFLRNKVVLQFKDCHDKVILASKGASNIKDYKQGFQEALKQTFVIIPLSNPTIISTEVEDKITGQEQANSNIEAASSSTTNMSSKYSNGKLNLQKVQIDNKQFILVKSDSSVPYATFKETTKRDVFRVKFENGDTTIGYYENGNIVIEVPSANGEYSKDVFSGK